MKGRIAAAAAAILLAPLLTLLTPGTAAAGGVGCAGGSEPVAVRNQGTGGSGNDLVHGGIYFAYNYHGRTLAWIAFPPYHVTAIWVGVGERAQWRAVGKRGKAGWLIYQSAKRFSWMRFCLSRNPHQSGYGMLGPPSVRQHFSSGRPPPRAAASKSPAPSWPSVAAIMQASTALLIIVAVVLYAIGRRRARDGLGGPI